MDLPDIIRHPIRLIIAGKLPPAPVEATANVLAPQNAIQPGLFVFVKYSHKHYSFTAARYSTTLTLLVKLHPYLATAMLTTYYFNDPEEALRRAKAAGKRPGCYFGGITLPSGKRGFAVYKDGKIVTQYAMVNEK